MALVVLIAGTTDEIGKAITRQIAATDNYHNLACRNEDRAQNQKNQKITYKIVDTFIHASIHSLTQI